MGTSSCIDIFTHILFHDALVHVVLLVWCKLSATLFDLFLHALPTNSFIGTYFLFSNVSNG